MLNDRRRRVLAALVEEYIATAQPVGSKCLVERYKLGCSPATVRNELAVLEETGYVFQPHISAGRVPTDFGYREFVSTIGEAVVARSRPTAGTDKRGGPTAAYDDEISIIHRLLGIHDREASGLAREAAALLSRLTNHVAVVLAPALSRARLRRLDLVPMSTRTALVVVITDTGEVAKRLMELPRALDPDELADVERYLCEALGGRLPQEAAVVARELLQAPTSFRELAAVVIDHVLDCLEEAERERLVHGGTAGLLGEPEFSDVSRVRPLLALLEDGLSLLRIVADATANTEMPTDVVVRIGHENPVDELADMSLVATGWGERAARGVVCLIGPTRMDYHRAMTAVRITAETLDRQQDVPDETRPHGDNRNET